MPERIKVVSSQEASQAAKGTRRAPAKLLLEQLDGDYMIMSQLAERYGVHIETLRRLSRSPRIKAPSEAAQQGGMTIYLFNKDDVKELDEYFGYKESDA